ncbi:MAG: helix-turn-helix transcriptional regulator [Christensenellaceae bacterium]|jgi:transcriptional regulator with XRE-family HTH domain|nr:helix-turn-helix transcriptional regulator [Christensenellaceae bacterium]
MDILQQITSLCEARGWSAYRLAKEAGIPQSTLSNLYKRKNSPTVSTLSAICGAFGISLSQFFAGADEGHALTADQQELLQKWVILSPSQKERVMAYILGCLQQ